MAIEYCMANPGLTSGEIDTKGSCGTSASTDLSLFQLLFVIFLQSWVFPLSQAKRVLTGRTLLLVSRLAAITLESVLTYFFQVA